MLLFGEFDDDNDRYYDEFYMKTPHFEKLKYINSLLSSYHINPHPNKRCACINTRDQPLSTPLLSRLLFSYQKKKEKKRPKQKPSLGTILMPWL